MIPDGGLVLNQIPAPMLQIFTLLSEREREREREKISSLQETFFSEKTTLNI
jgi:hypothetical protein